MNKIKRVIGDFFYDMSVKFSPKRKSNKKNTRKRQRRIFYITIVALPILQFLVFYVGVNINSIILAFQEYDLTTGQYSFAGFNNFSKFFGDLTSVTHLKASIRNSFIVYFSGLILGTLPALMFSFYIYKKSKFSNFFKMMLFLPQILSSLALVLMFKFFAERALPEIWLLLFNQSVNINIDFGLVLMYSIFSGFGTAILLYSSSMSGISQSMVEAAQIDGITPFKEFTHITLPQIYPMLVTFVVVGLAGIFVNQMNLFDFFGVDADYEMYNFGYYLYRTMKHHNTTIADYPYIAAIGLVLTAVTLPLTLIVKKFLEYIGPSTEK